MKTRKKWTTVESHLGVFTVWVVKGDVKNDSGEDVNGHFDVDAREILIAYSPNVRQMEMSLHHELTHVGLAPVSGVLWAAVCGGGNQREELIVSTIELTQFDLLYRNGFIRYPEPPKW